MIKGFLGKEPLVELKGKDAKKEEEGAEENFVPKEEEEAEEKLRDRAEEYRRDKRSRELSKKVR